MTRPDDVRSSRLNARYHVALWPAELLPARNVVDRRGGAAKGTYSSHLDVDRRTRATPDIVWTLDDEPAAVIDLHDNAEKPAGHPNADTYQMLAYCTVRSLADGHPIHAEGCVVVVAHTVRNTESRSTRAASTSTSTRPGCRRASTHSRRRSRRTRSPLP